MNRHISEEELARVYIHARLLHCPLGGNPEDCPLHPIRKRPIYERYEWLDGQSDEEVMHFFERHSDCVDRKLKKD